MHIAFRLDPGISVLTLPYLHPRPISTGTTRNRHDRLTLVDYRHAVLFILIFRDPELVEGTQRSEHTTS